MTAHGEFAFSAECHTDASTVMRVLDDVDGWTKWARPLIVQARWERWGEGQPGGPGAIRKLGAWPLWIREMIVSRESCGHAYTVISPALFSHYLGAVTIRDRATGVEVEWRVSFVARHSVMKPLLQAVLKTTIAGLLKRLTATAEVASTPELKRGRTR